MRKMCQSLQFVVTPEEKNLFSKNDKNAKNESISQQFVRLYLGFYI